MQHFQRAFIRFAIETGALRFGRFVLKSGRASPYFFDAGQFHTGASLARLGEFYARAVMHVGLSPDMLFGPAYKGIPLVCATSIALNTLRGDPTPFAFDRKEAKTHGEGGRVIGAPLKGSVLILDDVITTGGSIQEAVMTIREAGAFPSGVLIALDRKERARTTASAADDIVRTCQIAVHAIVTLHDVVTYLKAEGDHAGPLKALTAYRERFGVP